MHAIPGRFAPGSIAIPSATVYAAIVDERWP